MAWLWARSLHSHPQDAKPQCPLGRVPDCAPTGAMQSLGHELRGHKVLSPGLGIALPQDWQHQFCPLKWHWHMWGHHRDMEPTMGQGC